MLVHSFLIVFVAFDVRVIHPYFLKDYLGVEFSLFHECLIEIISETVVLYHLSHTPRTLLFFRWVLMLFFFSPSAGFEPQSSYLSLPCSLDYRCVTVPNHLFISLWLL